MYVCKAVNSLTVFDGHFPELSNNNKLPRVLPRTLPNSALARDDLTQGLPVGQKVSNKYVVYD